MGVDVLMREIATLGQEDRRKLAAYLVVLEDGNRPGYKEELARRADEQDGDRWVGLGELDERLGLAKHE